MTNSLKYVKICETIVSHLNIVVYTLCANRIIPVYSYLRVRIYISAAIVFYNYTTDASVCKYTKCMFYPASVAYERPVFLRTFLETIKIELLFCFACTLLGRNHCAAGAAVKRDGQSDSGVDYRRHRGNNVLDNMSVAIRRTRVRLFACIVAHTTTMFKRWSDLHV